MLKINTLLAVTFISSSMLPIHAEISHPAAKVITSTNVQTQPAADDQKTVEYSPEVQQEMTDALKAAQSWVQLIDQGHYEESWDKASQIMQKTISKKEWARALDIARKKLGPVKDRTLKEERPAWDPKRLPPGIYMVVEYNTSFTRVTHSGELLTLRKEPDGKWRVLTYLVN